MEHTLLDENLVFFIADGSVWAVVKKKQKTSKNASRQRAPAVETQTSWVLSDLEIDYAFIMLLITSKYIGPMLAGKLA